MNTATRDTTLPTAKLEQQPRRPDQRRGQNREARRNRSTAQPLDGYAQILSNHRRRLTATAMIYQDQLSIYPPEIQDTLRSLMELRRLVGIASAYLRCLTPVETQRMRPSGSITKLRTLDALLTELLLNLAMFTRVCQALRPERVQLHMDIRAAFPPLLNCYDDLLAQLTALADKARQIQPIAATQEDYQQAGQA